MPSGYSVLENVAVEDDKFCVVKNGHNSACVKFSLIDLSTDRTIKFPDSDETIGHTKANNITTGTGNVNITTTNGNIQISGDAASNFTTTSGILTLDGDDGTIIKTGASSGYIQLQPNNVLGMLVATNTPGTITLINGAIYDNTYSLKVNGHINATLNVIANAYGTNSDDRLKEYEVLITDATTTLKKLNPQTYLKKQSMDTADTTNAIEESGLIAQDIYYQAPELRHLINLADDAFPAPSITIPSDPTQDPDYSSWGSKPSSINYTGLIAYLVKSVQELSARIDTLETP